MRVPPHPIAGGAALACALLAACRAPAPLADDDVRRRLVPVAVGLPLPAVLQERAVEPQDPGPDEVQAPVPDPGPELLLPGPADDAVVATVGPHTLRKSHVFDRLATSNPRLATDVIDLLVLDLLVAGHAQEHGIRVDGARVERLVDREVELIAEGVRGQFDGVDLETYVRANFAMGLADFRELVRLRLAQRFYHDTVVRFMALREDRVRVRYIVNRDAELMARIARKVEEGADFGSLALQHSEDESRRENGLLPPFGPGFEHPIAAAAFSLEAGGVSPVFMVDGRSGPRHYLVYCLERLPGRPDAAYDDVAEEIATSLRDSACSDFETRAYILRHSDRLDRIGGVELAPRTVLDGERSNR